MNIEALLRKKGLYRDVIGVIVDFIGGDKCYWKNRNQSVVRAVTNGRSILDFDSLRLDFIHFIGLQHEYDPYNTNENVIANTMKQSGKSIGIRSYLKQQHIVAQLYYHKLMNRLRRSVYETPSLYEYGPYEQGKRMLLDFDYTPSIYTFGNSRNVGRIMKNRWVGSIPQQSQFLLVLEEVKYTFEQQERQEKIELRRKNRFQIGMCFEIKGISYQVIRVYENALKLRTSHEEVKFLRFMKDEDQCVYVFVDRLWRYRFYTDNKVEKVW